MITILFYFVVASMILYSRDTCSPYSISNFGPVRFITYFLTTVCECQRTSDVRICVCELCQLLSSIQATIFSLVQCHCSLSISYLSEPYSFCWLSWLYEPASQTCSSKCGSALDKHTSVYSKQGLMLVTLLLSGRYSRYYTSESNFVQ